MYKLTKRAPQYAPSNYATMYIIPRAIGNLASPLLNMHANVTAGLKCDPDIFQQKQVIRNKPARMTDWLPLVKKRILVYFLSYFKMSSSVRVY